jgi:hypothetical protein
MSLQSIVRTHIRDCRPRAEEHLAWFEGQPSLAEAIRTAALALNSRSRRSSHFWRVPEATLQQAYRVLAQNQAQVQGCRGFDRLRALVGQLVGPIKGLGELYVYDTAFRVAANLGFLPDKVYLHAGARRGARALRLDFRAKALEASHLPKELQGLEPYEIEDLLCMFKDRLKSATADDADGSGQAGLRCNVPFTSKGGG